MEDHQANDGIRGRLGSRGEDALSDVAQVLLDNPLLNQALQAAFGARDIASSATSQAMKGVGVGTAADVERLTRRLRSISDRLEAVEDNLDELTDELAALRRSQGEASDEPADPTETTVPVDQVRLGLSE